MIIGEMPPPAGTFGVDAIAMTMRFGDFLALDNVELKVRPGTFHALLGENGAGKSTLCNIVFGVHQPDGGFLRAEPEIHAQVAPQPTEVIVTKRRVGAFATTDLESVLRAHEVTCLVLLGIATSGVVLSTVRWAADADYALIVLEDCCADADEEVHRVLMQKVFPRQATVVPSQAFLQALAPEAELVAQIDGLVRQQSGTELSVAPCIATS